MAKGESELRRMSVLQRINRAGNKYVFWVNGLDMSALSDKARTQQELWKLQRRALIWIVIGVSMFLAIFALIAAMISLF